MADRQRTGVRQSPYRPYHTGSSSRSGMQVTTRRRPKARFFVILGAVLTVVLMVVVLLIRAQATTPVEQGQAVFDKQYDMLIIRTEAVYEGKNYGKTDFIAEEGQRIAAGDAIAEVYSWEYNDDTLSQLLSLQQTILDYEENVSRAGVIDPQLNDINSRINGKVAEIQGVVSAKDSQKALALQRELEALLDERSEYLRGAVVADNTLTGYYDNEAALLATIDEWRTELSASQDGVVSFYFDGCEALMTPANIGSFTEDALEEVAAGKTIETEGDDAAYAPLYRIVDTTDWYVVMYSADAIPEMHVGNAFSLLFDDYTDFQYTGVVYNATTLENNGGFVYTIRIRDDIGPLIGERRVSARLYGEQEGLRVKKGCVSVSDGEPYVETADGEYVRVEIIADGGEYYLVRTIEGGGSLSVGQRIRG